MKAVSFGASVQRVSSENDGSDEREAEVADLAKKAAQAASRRRKRRRDNPSGITAEDVDDEALNALDAELEEIASSSPGFAGAMMFRGPEVLPLVSLITTSDKEGIRRVLMRAAGSVREEMEMTDRLAIGTYLDSVSSTTQGAILSTALDDDIFVMVIEGKPAKIADAWHAMSTRRSSIQSALEALINAPDQPR